MPTTYKVLGQTSTTAATTTAYDNLITDGTFDNLTVGTSTLNNISTGGLKAFTGTTWKFGGESINETTAYDGVNLFGAGNSKAAKDGANSMYLYQSAGTRISTLAFGYPDATTYNQLVSTTLSTSGMMPVVAGTTYYWGGSVLYTSATANTATMRVTWYTSAGAYISASTSTITLVQNTWVRSTSSAAAPSTAAFAAIYFQCNTLTGTYFGLDSVHFSTVSSTNTTFPAPVAAASANVTLTSPFSTRISQSWSGTAYASTTYSSYAGALTDLYTVPSATNAVASSITVANLGTSATTYRILVLPSGQTSAKKNFIAFDAPIGANSTDTFTLGMTLAAGDKVQVASDSANVSATLFGSEIS